MRIDLHVHTSEVSPCGKVEAAEMMQLYKAAGYDAVAITDHMSATLNTLAEGTTYAEKAEIWLRGFRSARAMGEKLGLQVLLGAEFRLVAYGDEDFLAYGFTEQDVPALLEILTTAETIAEMSERVHEMGVFIAQAHPFRPGLRAQETAILDGVEAYNGNPRHNSQNELARAMALSGNCVHLGGSDAHRSEDVGRGGLVIDAAIADSKELAAWLRANGPRTAEAFDAIAIQTI